MSLLSHYVSAVFRRLGGAPSRVPAVSSEVDQIIPESPVTRAELHAEADRLAQAKLGISEHEAYAKLAAGEFANTAFAARMESIKWLLNEQSSEPPLAAE